ncbi:MAG: GyrI-like domain-containing protein [bacterium]
MLKWILIVGLLIGVVLVALAYRIMKGPDLSKYEALKEPRITKIPNQRMLVVEIKGDPNIVAKKAFATLFKTYYRLKNNPKRFQLAPCARWPLSLDTPKSEWIGRYGLPVSETAQLPDNFKQNPNMKVEIKDWEYGDVAEILHIGPYSEEAPTIERLHNFIKENGYKIIGEHEEEYLKGPGMFGKGNPKKYYTIIRLKVAK